MKAFKNVTILLIIFICFGFISFGVYRIIANGFETGMQLLSQFSPIVTGSTTFYLLYQKYFAKNKTK